MAKRAKSIQILTPQEKRLRNGKGKPTYRPSKTLDLKLTQSQKAGAVQLFNMAKDILVNVTLDVDINTKRILLTAVNVIGGIEFDIDAGSRPLEDAVNKSNIRGGIQKYLKFLS